MQTHPVKRRFLINSGLVAGLLILLIIVFWPQRQIQTGDIYPFAEIKKSEIERIEIHYREGAEYILQRVNERWRISAPIDIAANEYLINRFLDLLHAKAIADYVVAAPALSEFGLDPPLTRVHLNQYTIDFGDIDPVRQLRYVLYNGGLYLFDDSYHPILAGRLSSLADNRLLPEEKNPIAFLLPDFRLERNKSAGWLLQPGNPQLSGDDLQNWVDAWRYTRALYLARKSPEQSEIKQQIKVEFNDGSSIDYSVLSTPGQQIFYRPDIDLMFHLPKQAYLTLTSPPQADIEIIDAATKP